MRVEHVHPRLKYPQLGGCHPHLPGRGQIPSSQRLSPRPCQDVGLLPRRWRRPEEMTPRLLLVFT